MKTRKRDGSRRRLMTTKLIDKRRIKEESSASKEAPVPSTSTSDDCPTTDVSTALHISTCQGTREDIIRMIHILQSDPGALTRDQDSSRDVKRQAIYPEQFSPLHDAAEQGHVRCAQFLIAAGCDADIVCKNMTPLQNIVMSDYSSGYKISMAKTLLKNNASVNVTWDDKAAKTAMIRYAIKNREYLLIKLLLDYGALTEHFADPTGKPFPCKYSRKTPLASAVNYLDAEAVRLLLIRGASIKFYCDLSDSEYFSVPLFILNRIAWCPLAVGLTEIKDAIKILFIFKEFGGKLPIVPFRVGDHNCRLSNSSTNNGRFDTLHLKPEVGCRVLPILVNLVEMVSTPRTLASFCRMAIINQMGKNFWTNKDKLPLPKDIIKYLVEHPRLDEDISLDMRGRPRERGVHS